MRATTAALAAALTLSTAVAPGLARAQTSAPPPTDAPAAAAPAEPSPAPAVPAAPAVDPRLLAVGAGAVFGIVAFNVLTVPLGTVPLAGAALAAVPVEIAHGSRLLAAVSGAAGAFLAAEAYSRWTDEPYDFGYLATLGLGALGGIAVGNVLGGSIGYLPYYVGAGETAGMGAAGFASAAAQAASRVHVIASGVLGAWVADYLYAP